MSLLHCKYWEWLPDHGLSWSWPVLTSQDRLRLQFSQDRSGPRTGPKSSPVLQGLENQSSPPELDQSCSATVFGPENLGQKIRFDRTPGPYKRISCPVGDIYPNCNAYREPGSHAAGIHCTNLYMRSVLYVGRGGRLKTSATSDRASLRRLGTATRLCNTCLI